MTDRATEALLDLACYLRDRIASDPNVYYYCGPGCEVFRRLAVALKEVWGSSEQELRDEVGLGSAGQPEVLRLRAELRRLQG